MALAAVALAVVALAFALRQVAAWRARWALPTGAAQWIWAERDRRNPYPVSFYAARDFTLASPPARATLLAAADQEYVLYLNGIRVGAGWHRPGGVLDVYEVAPLLAPGANRLVAELRSAHGDGGFLASLEDPASGRKLLVTDGTWRTFERHRLGLVRGWLGLDREGAAPLRWGLPPLGRWGWPAVGRRRPLFGELVGAGARVEASGSAAAGPEPPRGERTPHPGFVELDWGRPVAGYLALELGYEPGLPAALARPPADQQRIGLLYFGLQPPPEDLGQAAAAEVLLMPGEREWLDVRPRRFRYALVAGFERPLTARLYPLDPRSGGPLLAESERSGEGGPRRGVAGVAPPPLHTPAEDEVRRRIERLGGAAAQPAGNAGRPAGSAGADGNAGRPAGSGGQNP